MPSDEQASSKSWLYDNNTRILIATLTAITLAAGSTVIWRAKHIAQPAALFGSGSGLDASPGEIRAGEGNMNHQEAGGEVGGASKSSKNSRSKERRKRGKDPVKELTKVVSINPKKTKKRASSKARSDTTTSSAVVVPEIIEPGNGAESTLGVSVDESTASSSRSSSISMAKDPSLLNVIDREAEEEEPGDENVTLYTSITSSASALSAHEDPQHNSFIASQSDIIHVTDPEGVLSPSTFASSSSLTSPPSSTPSSSPTPSFVPETPRDAMLHPSLSMYPHYTSPSPSRRMSPSPNGSWDYSNNGMADPSTTYIKPPRFRSKSRGSGSVSPAPMLTSVSYPSPHNGSATLSPAPNPIFLPTSNSSSSAASSSEKSSEILPTFTFPTLNPSPTPSPGPSNTRPQININATLQPSRTPTPSQSHSPRRTPTPSSASSSVSVSAQTQVASLRGALEAARMREEKAKAEVERLGKECQELRMRWGEDVGLWRIREGELHNHIQVLMQHLQGYASILASFPQTAHLQMPMPMPYSNIPPNGIPSHIYTASPRPSPSPMTTAQSQSPRSHPTSPHQGLTSPLSPLAVYPSMQVPQLQPQSMGSPTNPFASPPKNQSHPSNQQYQNQNHNLFSLFFPGSGGPSSGVSSGSTSPAGGSPVGDRGRRRLRTRTATQRDQDGQLTNETNVDMLEVNGGDEQQEDEEFSGILADAILKRPESIRGGSSRVAKRVKENAATEDGSDGGGMGKSLRKADVNLNEVDTKEGEDGWIRGAPVHTNGSQSTALGSAGEGS